MGGAGGRSRVSAATASRRTSGAGSSPATRISAWRAWGTPSRTDARIAAIRVIGDIRITSGAGIFGKDLDDNIDSARYRDPDGNPINDPVLDGRLVDGAIVYQTLKKGDKLPAGDRSFQLVGQQLPPPRHT